MSQKIGTFIIDEDGQIVECDSLRLWGEWMQKADRHVAQDILHGPPPKNKIWRVSTVFLGLDHNHSGYGPPVLFETMVFDITKGSKFGSEGWRDLDMDRYCTSEQALEGHKRMVEKFKARKE